MTHFAEKFSQKSSIIYVRNNFQCASGIQQNSHCENHLCWRPFCSETLRCLSATLLWKLSHRGFPENFPKFCWNKFQNCLTYFSFHHKFFFPFMFVSQNLTKSYLMILNSNTFDCKILFMLFQEISLTRYLGYRGVARTPGNI